MARCKSGALIGKIGGSAVDRPEAAPTGADTLPYPGRKVFPIGKLCVIQIAKDNGGPLFMTMNDEPGGFAVHNGSLHVLIEEAAV